MMRIAMVALVLAAGAIVAQTQDQPGQSSSTQSGSSQSSPSQSSSSQASQDSPAQNQSGQNQTNQNQPSQAQPDQAQQKDQGNPQQAPVPQSSPPENPAPNNPSPAAVVGEAAKQLGQQTLVKVRDWETEWLIGAYVGRNRPLAPLTAEGREQIYLHQTFLTPGAYLKRLFDAGIDQARGSPSQWGGGIGGYSERFASREGQFFAANSLAALGDAKLRYEPRYDQCKCRGFWPRLRHAFVRNLVTYNETEKELRPQWGLYGGAFGGGMIATAWKPKTHNVFTEGAYAALGQVGWGTLENFFTEFAVDINRKLGGK
jgi:hypothetical protein